MGGCSVDRDENALTDVLDREVGDRVVARFVEQDRLFAVGDPRVVETDPQAAAGRLREQQPIGQGSIGEEAPDRARVRVVLAARTAPWPSAPGGVERRPHKLVGELGDGVGLFF